MLKSPIVLAAGGTGGHIFPAESLAAELAKKGHTVVFITDRQGRKFTTLPESVQVMSIPIPRRRNTPLGLIKFSVGLLRAMYHVYRGFRRMRPIAVVGFGGYPSFPACSIAQILKIPTILHEQNAVLGQVNRWLAKKASTLALSFEDTTGVDESMPTKVVGTPIRKSFYIARDSVYHPSLPDDIFFLLVTGGSQGARVFSEVVPAAIAKLSISDKARIRIVHQCPERGVDALTKAYDKLGVKANVVVFIKNMAEEMRKAHLVLARSGASTLAEIAVVGRPSVLIPFPHAKDNHQWKNAQTLARAGGAWCVNQAAFSAEYFSAHLKLCLLSDELLCQFAKAAKSSAKTDALDQLVTIIEKHIKKGDQL